MKQSHHAELKQAVAVKAKAAASIDDILLFAAVPGEHAQEGIWLPLEQVADTKEESVLDGMQLSVLVDADADASVAGKSTAAYVPDALYGVLGMSGGGIPLPPESNPVQAQEVNRDETPVLPISSHGSVNKLAVAGGVVLGAGALVALAGSGGEGEHTASVTSNNSASTGSSSTGTSSGTSTDNSNSVSAKISLNSVESDHIVSTQGSESLVLLSGSLSTTDSDMQTYLAQGLVSQVTVSINGKSYQADVDADSLSFSFYASRSDLAAAAGSAVQMSLTESPISYLMDTVISGTYILNSSGIPEDADLSVVQASLQDSENGSIISGTVGQYTVNSSFTDGVYISGTVSGTAQAGDSVVVNVNGHEYSTTVASDNSFGVTVSRSELAEDADHQIEAYLNTHDSAGNAVTVSDGDSYAVTTASNGADVGESGQSTLPYFINALNNGTHPQGYLDNTEKWAGVGSAITINYAFDSGSGVDGLTGDALSNSLAFSSQQIADITQLLAKFGQYANITLVAVSDKASADVVFYLDDLTSVNMSADTVGYAYAGGDVHLSSNYYSDDDAFSKVEGATTVLHEMMHSLGFEHPFEVIEDSNNSVVLDAAEDQNSYTLMSYTATDVVGLNDLRVFDLAALQYNYGVNASERSGNDVYTFAQFNAGSSDGSVYVWDGAGVDTFDASTAAAGVTVDLTPGSWNYIGEKSQYFISDGTQTVSYQSLFNLSATDKVVDGWDDATNTAIYSTTTEQTVYTSGQSFIGYHTQLENLVGSAYNDHLTGNAADNLIEGGAGNDTINGGLGNDSLDGGSGTDYLAGGAGDDAYYVDSTQDTVVEQTGEGTDTVYSSVDFTLGSYVENLTLLGNTVINGSGNDLANVLTGNTAANTLNGGAGNDTLIGGLGSDTLTGGSGQDHFVFDTALNGDVDTITDFSVGSDHLVLSSAIFGQLDLSDSSLLVFGDAQEQASSRFVYDSSNQTLAYDADGSGSAASVVFAHLSLDAAATAANIFVVA